MKIKFILLLLIANLNLFGQIITHGPVMGAMTDNSLRVYLRTDSTRQFVIEIDTDSLFSNPLSFSDSTSLLFDNSRIVNISGLSAETKYFYRIIFDQTIDIKKGSFKTFPAEGQSANFSFITGSCQETANMKVFDVIPTHNPMFFLHTGDFTYPSYQLPSSYPSQWSSIPLSYQKRYEELVMKDKLLPFFPIVYMPDDDDNFGISRTNHVRTGHTGSGSLATSFFITDTILPIERENCLRGYRYFFPGYQTIDTTEGHYHSFKIANAEFFVLDARSMADPLHLAYKLDTNNRWIFSPEPGHSIIGTNQMNWLLNGLSNSTAHWKFIVTGVPFNPKIRNIIEAGLLVQNIVFNIAGETGTGLRLSASFAGYWAGYPQDIQTLTSHVNNNNIERVLLISGDTHHNVMDDGTNTVFPELNASGLSVSTTELAYQIAQYAPILGQPAVVDSLWNGGGNGLRNTNFLNGFGKVEVFGADSVKYCVIDENDEIISCMTISSDGSVYNPTGIETINALEIDNNEMSIFPNPNTGNFNLKIKSTYLGDAVFTVLDVNGRLIFEQNLDLKSNSNIFQISLQKDIPKGNYFSILRSSDGTLLKVASFQKF